MADKMNELCFEGERIDDLQFKNLKIIQNTEHFCFGADAVLLARFSLPKDSDSIMDLGCGTGIIPIMVSGICSSEKIVGIDIQECMCNMAARSIELNGLHDRVEIRHMDLRVARSEYAYGSFSLVISNPPYIKAGSGIVNDHDQKAVSRHEVTCRLEDVASAAGHLLCNKGRFALVHKPSRAIECFDELKKNGLEPKRIQLIYPTINKAPSAILIEAIKGGREGIKFLRPIILMDENGEYTHQTKKIYSDSGKEIFS